MMVGKAVAGQECFLLVPQDTGGGAVSSCELALELQTHQGKGAAPSPCSRVSGSGSWERENCLWSRMLKLASHK